MTQVTLDRPEKLNALSLSLRRGLIDLWRQIGENDEVRCVILTGAGRGFCSGADVADLTSDREILGLDVEEELAFLPGDQLSVPVVVAVNGICAGAGLHFVADADIVIASDTASFVDPHVSVGQVSGLEPMMLAATGRWDLAARMALLGVEEQLTAEQAQRAGYVSEVLGGEALMARAHQIAAAIAQQSPEAVRISRQLIRDWRHDQYRRPLQAAWDAVRDHWKHPDSEEGPRAFAENRKPRWTRHGGTG